MGRYGENYTCLMVEPRIYLKYLKDRFLQLGGKIEQRKLFSFDEIADSCDLIINCSGLKSHELEADAELKPVRGQVLRVYAPWVKQWVFTDNGCYIIPCQEDVVVGGTRQHGDDDTSIRSHESDEIMKKAVQVMPSLKRAKIVGSWTGLRPYRNKI